MREAGEYAVGIFHGSIIAIQSRNADKREQERGRNLSFRRGGERAGMRFIRRRDTGRGRGVVCESGDVLSNVLLHPSQRDPVGVFFPFPGNRMEKGA